MTRVRQRLGAVAVSAALAGAWLGAQACVPSRGFDPSAGGDGAAPGDDAADGATGSEGGPSGSFAAFAVNADVYHGSMCAYRGERLYCWGDVDSNAFGQLGVPLTDAGVAYPVPVVAPTRGVARELVLGQEHACSLYGRDPYCRGRRYERGNGAGATDGPEETLVALQGAAKGLDTIAAAYYATCGIDLAATGGPTSNVYCWGGGAEATLGRPPGDPRLAQMLAWPVTGDVDGGPTGAIPDARVIAGGGYHFCVITSAKKILCWGSTQWLESGPSAGLPCPMSNVTSCQDQPQEVPLPPGEVALGLALGDHHSCAVAESGKVFCWGANDQNQLGTATAVTQTCGAVPCSGVALPVAGLTNAKSIRAGDDHTCALDASHHAYCWGRNDVGQLGIGSGAPQPSPALVLSDQSLPLAFDDLRAGAGRTCGESGATLYCWGELPIGASIPDGGAPNGWWPWPAIVGF